MCLFCCDMLCWFSFITCCGCRDMVTRRLVFFPPEPYYDQIEPNEEFNDFYHRLSSQEQQEEDDDIKTDDDDREDDIVLEIKSPKNSKKNKRPQPMNNDTEMEALNSSDDSTNTSNKKKHKTSDNINAINESTFGIFRIRDDELNLRDFYWNNYSIQINNFESQYLLTERGTTIPSYYIRNPSSSYVILFSHGNAADIGLMRNHLCRMYNKCQNISIFAYEYSGYGKSSGKPSESNTYSDISAAYKYLTLELKYKPCHIILYGQSLGTCVSIWLGSVSPVAGIILHSPLMSGLRVMQHFDKTYWFDIYPVIDQIQHCYAPIFVIHGNKDKEIDIIHGKILSRIAPNSYQPWFVPYAGHNDIEVLFPDILFKKIKKFIKYLKNLEKQYIENPKYNSNEFEKDMTIDDIDIDIEEEEEDGSYLNINNITKSVTQKNLIDESISPPPPQSILTKSAEIRSRQQITLPSRKFSATAHSILCDDVMGMTMDDGMDDGSVLKTPSVGGSDITNTNANVLTPTMRTIISKGDLDHSLNTATSAEPLFLDNSISTAVHFKNINYNTMKRKSQRRPGGDKNTNNIDEEKEIIIINNNKIRRKNMKRKKINCMNKNKRLNLPQSKHMKYNIEKCFQRRDKLLIQDINHNTSEESDDNNQQQDQKNHHNNNNNNSDTSIDIQLAEQNINGKKNNKKQKS